ncbi:MAG: DUF3147 family protein [Bacteroidia bacterium]|nr:DUF3147 family protein [Bacteroidia bacterium]
MITKIFLLQLLLTFLIGSCWIYFTVLAGLRLGSKTGGFIGGLPSTALLSFFFVGFTQSPEIASSATTIFPIAIAISGLFLVVYAFIARLGFMLALISSLCFWFLLSTIVVFFRWEKFILNLAIYAAVMLFAYFILEKYLLIKSVSSQKNGQPEKHLAIRSVFGGAVVMSTVLIARIGNPELEGVIAAFPAMFISTLTISYQAHGIEFSRAMTKPLMVTGMITLAVYAIALRYLYLYTGLYLGTFLSICVSAISAYLTYRFILPRLK